LGIEFDRQLLLPEIEIVAHDIPSYRSSLYHNVINATSLTAKNHIIRAIDGVEGFLHLHDDAAGD